MRRTECHGTKEVKRAEGGPVRLLPHLALGAVVVLAAVAGGAIAGPKPLSTNSADEGRIVSAELHQEYRELLPIVADPDLQQALESQRILFYTEREMPRAFGKWNGRLAGLHSAYYNISAGAGEPYGNGNREFPWDSAGGTHRSEGFETIHFVWLPTDERGEILPIVYEARPSDAPGLGKVTWRFPHGAVVGECLVIKFSDGDKLPCELRIRRRVEADWETDVFRPFPTASALAERIQQIRDGWREDETLSQLVAHLSDSENLKQATLRDNHPNRTFDQVAGVDSMPQMDEALVKDLLKNSVFETCHELAWKENSAGLKCFAPTTEFPGQIVPRNYDGGFIRVNNQSCLRCHSTVGDDVSKFEFSREWYGVIRGSDGIFSFHPYERSSISGNGFGNEIRVRRDLVDAGVLARFDEMRHPREHYSLFKYQ